MRIETTTVVERVNNDKAFTFEKNAASFQLLSSKLYANKPRAVIRELSCNALDAHVAIGTPNRPIEVKIPNTLDSSFYIKDFGPGLSDEDMVGLYTTYFKSTKRNSDDFIGGFGVGSKSPFAYTDSFTVESRFAGVKTIYTAYLAENGTPTISKMASSPTTEETGLTVGFQVKASDFADFQKEANFVFSTFPVQPAINGMVLTKMDRKVIMETPTVSLYSRQKNDVGPTLIIGAVQYPLQKYKDYINERTLSWLTQILDQNIVIRVPVGSVNVAVSREELSFDTTTLKELPLLLAEARESLLEKLTHFAQWDEPTQEQVRNYFVSNALFDFLASEKYPDAARIVQSSSAPYEQPNIDILVIASKISANMNPVRLASKFGILDSAVKKEIDPIDYSKEETSTVWGKLQKNGKTLLKTMGDLKETYDGGVTFFKVDNIPQTVREQQAILSVLLKKRRELGNAVAILVPKQEHLAEFHVTTDRYFSEQVNAAQKNGAPAAENITLLVNHEAVYKLATSGEREQFRADWAYQIIPMPKSTGYLTQIKRVGIGANKEKVKNKNWVPLPGQDTLIKTEEGRYFLEYNSQENTYSGLTPTRVDVLIKSAEELGIDAAKIVIVPKDSSLLKTKEWRGLIPAWKELYKQTTYIQHRKRDDNEAFSALPEFNKKMKIAYSTLWGESKACAVLTNLETTESLYDTEPYYTMSFREILKIEFNVKMTNKAGDMVGPLDDVRRQLPMLYVVAYANGKKGAIDATGAQHLINYVNDHLSVQEETTQTVSLP